MDSGTTRAISPSTPLSDQAPRLSRPADSLAGRLAAGEATIALTFAGNGFNAMPDLEELYVESPRAKEWIEIAARALADLASSNDFRWSGLVPHGIDLVRWLDDDSTRPPAHYLTSSAVSQPIIFVAQIARYLQVYEAGLHRAFENGAVVAASGYSQGMMPALLVSESDGGEIRTSRALSYMAWFAWQGIEMQRSYDDLAAPRATDPSITPMAALVGLTRAELDAELAVINEGLPAHHRLYAPLAIGRERFLLSGAPATIQAFQQRIEARGAKEQKDKSRGRRGGRVVAVTLDPLAVSAAFHSPYMQQGLDRVRARLAAMGLELDHDKLAFPVISPATAQPLGVTGDLTEEAVVAMHVGPVRWDEVVERLAEEGAAQPSSRPLAGVVDCGAGDAVNRLNAGILRGRGVRTFGLATRAGRDAVFVREVDTLDRPVCYDDYAPSLATLDGRTVVDNIYTRATGHAPVILPGMTPTTVEVPIVAAAANAGFTAELAGGGQVTERIFWLRMQELREHLDPGREVVFNALYLDPYLWSLHVAKERLIFRARRAGYPLCGLTISAGIPDTDEAVALLDELVEHGMWLNAFKPGTPGQVRRVLDIAAAAPHHTLFVHLEGGKAGGHHSWEDLDDLLLACYHQLRRQPNVVLCVGGGIGDEPRATALLDGTWSVDATGRRMPVDAVFLGTLAMATKEAATSPQVKAALVAAAGGTAWVPTGTSDGDVTSGKSQLNADIHYLDNRAARCGRLLDQVAGDADAVAQRRGEIIEALDATAKPYFGDLTSMTYLEVLERMVELMAIGRGGRYEDGCWPDVSYRRRVLDFIRRCEARTSPRDEGELDSVANLEDLDDPDEVLSRLALACPRVTTELLHPADVHFFVRRVCARPGKPVPFVPVIDEDVRRWYKSDSLWQAHDDRFEADQVLTIPGPEAVQGIVRADEPVAELLDRFEGHLVTALERSGVRSRIKECRRTAPHVALPNGVLVDVSPGATTLRASEPTDTGGWLDFVASRFSGPLAAFVARPTITLGKRVIDNPIRRLCRAEPGALLVVESDDNRASEVTYYPADGGATNRVAVVLEKENGVARLRLEVQCSGTPSGDGETSWVLPLVHVRTPRGDWFVAAPEEEREAILEMYHRAMFGRRLEATPLFDPATAKITLDAEVVRAYAMVTGGDVCGPVPMNMAFSAVWEPLFSVLSCDEVAGGLLDLVHLDHGVTPGPAWPMRPGEELLATARLTEVSDSDQGRRIVASSTIERQGELVATVTSSFFVRGHFGETPRALVKMDRAVERLVLSDHPSLELLTTLPWIELEEDVTLAIGDQLLLIANVGVEQRRDGSGTMTATGQIRRGDELVATIDLDHLGRAATHPVLALVEALADASDEPRPVTRKTLAMGSTQAPQEMTTFAEVGRDFNPIHRSRLLARLAKLDEPIVHGMWTAAALHAFVVRELTDGDASRIQRFDVRFADIVRLGDEVHFEAVRAATVAGDLVIDLTASVERDERRVVVATGTTIVAAPTTAYVFPGQGIQDRNMGMAGYGRSAAARAVWDEADRYTRDHLGFSILQVVRENPRELLVHGKPVVHPRGVLHLTQFTQVAMAVLANAQTAELREAGVFVEDAIACGHSVGEYNALGAVFGVVPLTDVVDIVYNRGLTMHHYVPRDEAGNSDYRMGVIRPHYAGLDHAGAEDLVARIADETGEFLQIVNYNVWGRQYSVTGTVAALAALDEQLSARALPGAKAPYLEVPGIDVPFHSDVLRDGVDRFRKTLVERLPERIDHTRLTGRYIPNLVARPFAMTAEFLQSMIDVTDSAVAKELLAQLDDGVAQDPDRFARDVLVELLAWQFASPVRWIETQQILLSPDNGVARLVEVGVGYQPTLANMARYSATVMKADRPGRQILNLESDRDLVLSLDEDPAPAADESAEPDTDPVAEPVAAVAAAPVAAAPAAEVPDRNPTHGEALRTILALQGRVRPEQIDGGETIDELFDGVSSRRNQVLLDIGAEFNLGTIDGAHEKPIDELTTELAKRSPSYTAPGGYLKSAIDEMIKRVFGRASLSRRDVGAHLEQEWGLGQGLTTGTLLTLTWATRQGDSGRGGPLGGLEAQPGSKKAGLALVDAAAKHFGENAGLPLTKRVAAHGSAGGAVDSAALRELEERIIGPRGVLAEIAQTIDGAVGAKEDTSDPLAADPMAERLAQLDAEFGAELEEAVAPRFVAAKHVAFTESWAFAQRDVARLYHGAIAGTLTAIELDMEAGRLAAFASVPRIATTATFFAERAAANGHSDLARQLHRIAAGDSVAPVAVTPTRPKLTIDEHGMRYEEIGDAARRQVWLSRLLDDNGAPPAVSVAGASPLAAVDFGAALAELLSQPGRFADKTALVTGASPRSIAVEVVAHLLRGGARVIVTTTTYTDRRLQFYRDLYARQAAPGAELHVVPYNAASRQDTANLVAWMFGEVTRQNGADVKVLKRPMAPDLILPFAAMKQLGTLDQIDGLAEAAIRAMLLSVEQLVTAVATHYCRHGLLEEPCHVVLPLSPNHGVFGGDGVYGEVKAALEVLLNKWHSERDAWARAVSFSAATIGWVRGTGLMDANNPVAAELEKRTGAITFNTAEMGVLLAALLMPNVRRHSRHAPIRADLTGRFAAIENVGDVVTTIRDDLEAARLAAIRRAELASIVDPRPGGPDNDKVAALPSPPVAHIDHTPRWMNVRAHLDDTVVIVGAGELGPWGSARSRFDYEIAGELSAGSVCELAWLTGLIKFEGGTWIDVESGNEVAEHDIAGRYREAVTERAGIRFFEPELIGHDPDNLTAYTTVFLERDFTFSVATETEARSFAEGAPATTRVAYDADEDAWQVTRTAGSEIKLPRRVRLARRVAGMVPTGLDFALYGIPADMVDSVDRVALMNVVATVDAWMSAGLSPEELLRSLHPVRIANVQGGGIGGMQSLERLYIDPVLDNERQSDVLQETLINVLAAYVVQSYVGSYGPMSHPVGACATSMLSLEEGMDKILAGKADFAVAGGYDDIGPAGQVGFSDMAATADTDEMQAMGLTPRQMSRPNDARRGGFVEGQGGGTLLLCRGSLALELGLPVLGVLAYAGSFGDGIHKSIPAPGLGLLGAAMGGKDSALGRALRRFGLTADDIALVYKHDTSTNANDPNENEIHDRIQQALGRSPGNPLWVVSQKSITGHSKGGAASFQTIGLCQALATGRIPGNRNLDNVDPQMARFSSIGFTDQTIDSGEALKAGLVTSLGFGHVSGIALVLHANAFLAMVPTEQRAEYLATAVARRQRANRQRAEAMLGLRTPFEKRTHRRFASPDGTRCQVEEEAAMLLDPTARLDAATGIYRSFE